MNIIIQTNFTEKYQEEPTHKHVLHRDNLFYLYNQVDDHGIGWQTKSFTDLEKALKYFLTKIAEDRKTLFTAKKLKILCPNIPNNAFKTEYAEWLKEKVKE